MITLGVVTDLHFGSRALFDGKLRKMSDRAAALAEAFVARMREVRPDAVVNLGDAIEDEGHDADLERYRQCLEILGQAPCPVIHVAGNHDVKNLAAAELCRAWGLEPDGRLYRSLDLRGVHLVVLHTHERQDRDVTIDNRQLEWLAEDLDRSDRPTIVLMHHSAADQDLAGNRWFARAPHICLLKRRAALRALLRQHGDVRLVLNGHLHWNHLDVIEGLPFVTLQSLVENVDDDAPGTPAAAHAVVRLRGRHLHVEIAGAQPCRFQLDR